MLSFIADVILLCLAVIAPPAVAHIKTARKDLTLSIILTLFGWLPGILHAWFLIVKHPERLVRELPKEVAYVEGPHVEAQTPQHQPQHPQSYQPPPQQQWQGDAKHPPTYAG